MVKFLRFVRLRSNLCTCGEATFLIATEGILDINVEKLVEKGMDNHEKNWFEIFKVKHQAKKEIKELNHNQRIEMEEIKQKRKTRYQIRQEEKRKNKELENKQFMQGIALLLGMVILIIIIAVVFSILGLE